MGRAGDENLGIAFGLVIGAGAATALGAAAVFVPALVRLASRRTLASALGLSAGVMTYVSFVEIFAKSSLAFEDAGYDEDKAYIYATLCFFAGVALMVLLNQTVTWLLGGHHHHHHHEEDGEGRATGNLSSEVPQGAGNQFGQEGEAQEHEQEHEHDSAPHVCPCCTDDPAGQLEEVRQMAEEIENYESTQDQTWGGPQQNPVNSPSDSDTPSDEEEEEEEEEMRSTEQGRKSEDETKKLMRMSLNTALAIGLHNFPEGLATFVAALSDPSVGAVLAIAIAIHNVPEGLCVAMPVYYATGNKLKAFGWAILSGIAEPIAALLGWAVLANSFSDLSYGILFGLVSGMMVIISSRELLPTAHRYDPEDAVVTYSFMVGMAIMAVSLALFLL